MCVAPLESDFHLQRQFCVCLLMVDRILSMRVADLFKDAACVENLMENGDFFLGKSHAKKKKIKYKLKIMLTEKKKKKDLRNLKK